MPKDTKEIKDPRGRKSLPKKEKRVPIRFSVKGKNLVLVTAKIKAILKEFDV